MSLQYVFVSLLSRDSVYDVLRRICTHLQVCDLLYSALARPVSIILTAALLSGGREESESEAVPGGAQLVVHGNDDITLNLSKRPDFIHKSKHRISDETIHETKRLCFRTSFRRC